MRRSLVFTVAVYLCAFAADVAVAQFSNSGVPGAQQGDVHAPWSKNYLPLLPNQPIQYGSSRSFSYGYGVGGWGNFYAGWGYGWPGGYPYWYDGPFYPYAGPIVLPPVVMPAETLYGPQAVQRFMGVNPPQSPRTVIVANRPQTAVAPAKPNLRISNAAAKAQAGKFMAFGDALFQKQNFNSALVRYRTAAQSASDLPEPFMRQGFALVAMGSYDSAVKVMRRALLIENNPRKIKLQLEDLYGDNQMAKTAHLETLAKMVEENPQSADLLFLLGMALFFDDQPDRALPLLERCEQLGGNEDGAVSGFFTKPAPQIPAGPFRAPAAKANDGGRDL